MWPQEYGNPMIPEFEKTRINAANVPQPGEMGTYTKEMFQESFPQFFKKTVENDEAVYTPLLPEAVLNRFIQSANSSVLPSRWDDMWEYAAGLFVAHFVSMFLKTYSDGSTSGAEAAQNAAQVGNIKSATMGDTSVSYDNSAITAGTEKWGTWNATQYGAQLVSMARLIGMAGMYVI